MLSAKININGIDISLSGDKDDIIYALRNTTFEPNRIANTDAVAKLRASNQIKPIEKKPSLYSKEDSVKMYNYLAAQGEYTIKQFEITRGGKTNPAQYTVCLVFDNAKQRYIHYNPKSEDRFLRSYAINDVVAKLNANEPGFFLLHTVANKIWEKIGILNDLIKITTTPAQKPNIVKKGSKSKGFTIYVPQENVPFDVATMAAKKIAGKEMEEKVLQPIVEMKKTKTLQPVSKQHRVNGRFAKKVESTFDMPRRAAKKR